MEVQYSLNSMDRFLIFLRRYLIIILLLVMGVFIFNKFEFNKIKAASETVVEVQRLYQAQQKNWIVLKNKYEARIKTLESKKR